MATLDRKFRQHFGKLRKASGGGSEFRLPVLIYGTMAANERGRFWHDQQTIATDLGTYKPRISEAIDWLIEAGALEIVPKELRVGPEKRTRGHVYQLTGIITLESEAVNYLYLDGVTGSVTQKGTESVTVTDSVTGNGTDSAATVTESVSLHYNEVKKEVNQAEVEQPPQSPPADAPLDKTAAAAAAGEIFDLYQNNIAMITPLIADDIKDAIEEFKEQWVKDAITEAARSGGRSWKYVLGILKRWRQEGRAAPALGSPNPSPGSAPPPPHDDPYMPSEWFVMQNGKLVPDPDGHLDSGGNIRRAPKEVRGTLSFRKVHNAKSTAAS